MQSLYDYFCKGAVAVKPHVLAAWYARPLRLEALEDRRVLATTIFTDGVLTIRTTAANEDLTVWNWGDSLWVESSAGVGGAGGTFAPETINRIVVEDIDDFPGHSVTFHGGAPYTLSGGLASSGIETVTFYMPVDASGSTAGISVVAPQSIRVFTDLTVDVGDLTLSANQQATPASGSFHGIELGGTITTNGTGDILLQGRGGGVSGLGVAIGGSIQSTSTDALAGTITIDGVGSSEGSFNDSVVTNGAGTMITSVHGDIQVTGQEGNATGSYGVWLNSGTVSSTGTGPHAASIAIVGHGGSGSGDAGVVTGNDGTVASKDGDIQITGASASSTAIVLLSSSAIQATGTADVTLIGNAMVINAIDAIDAGENTVTLRPETSGTTIDIGGASGGAQLVLTAGALNQITAGTIVIGDENTGTITVSAPIQHTGDANFQVVTGRNIFMSSGASWTTTDGDLTFSANQQAAIAHDFRTAAGD